MHIFICFDWEEHRFAKDLQRALNQLPDVTAWIDDGMRSGEFANQHLPQLEDCHVLLAIISSNVHHSRFEAQPASFVYSRIHYATTLSSQPEIIPLVVKNTNTPDELLFYRTIDFSADLESAWLTLLEMLEVDVDEVMGWYELIAIGDGENAHSNESGESREHIFDSGTDWKKAAVFIGMICLVFSVFTFVSFGEPSFAYFNKVKSAQAAPITPTISRTSTTLRATYVPQVTPIPVAQHSSVTPHQNRHNATNTALPDMDTISGSTNTPTEVALVESVSITLLFPNDQSAPRNHFTIRIDDDSESVDLTTLSFSWNADNTEQRFDLEDLTQISGVVASLDTGQCIQLFLSTANLSPPLCDDVFPQPVTPANVFWEVQVGLFTIYQGNIELRDCSTVFNDSCTFNWPASAPRITPDDTNTPTPTQTATITGTITLTSSPTPSITVTSPTPTASLTLTNNTTISPTPSPTTTVTITPTVSPTTTVPVTTPPPPPTTETPSNLITNDNYRDCYDNGNGDCSAPPEYSRIFENHEYGTYPVVGVTWVYADIYCRTNGGRLPTTDELEDLDSRLDELEDWESRLVPAVWGRLDFIEWAIDSVTGTPVAVGLDNRVFERDPIAVGLHVVFRCVR